MVDIHCHLLYGVDDGAHTFDMSLMMLERAAGQGITHMIVTPHYRRGMFHWDRRAVSRRFRELFAAAADYGISLNIGCEYHADADMVNNLRDGKVPSLAGSEYVLTEFGHDCTYDHARDVLNDLIANGYIPVIAHTERCGIIQKDPLLAERFCEMGCRIQINAGGILGTEGSVEKRTCRKLLQEDLADIVASDSHDMDKRCCRMKECMIYVEKKYGTERARRLFESNPGMIIGLIGEI